MMLPHIKLKLHFTDRVGIVADVSALLASRDLSIVAMEVERKQDIADVYLELEHGEQTQNQEEIFEMLASVPDLREIRFIETLPQEEHIQRSRVVLDNISEGVFSIDNDGKITTINKVARKMLNCEHRKVIGQDVQTLDLPDDTILECLKGRTFDNVKQTLITKKGRFQFFASGKPISDSSHHIVGAVEIIKDMKEVKRLAQYLSQPRQITFSDFVGKHPAIQEVIVFGQKIARTNSVVSIRGESGTGKELFARAIHSESERTGQFVAVNCAALPQSLLESELFGYAGGAFTGAKKEGKPGLFELATEGTIFLDEIAEMPLNLQAKMLRLIQEQSVRRIGGSKEIPINTRIITATNKNLEEMVRDKTFRGDLYYRINVLPIHLPPLRERGEDIPLLVEYFLFQLASKLAHPTQSISQGALDKLCRHTWPGNIRELRNVIERAAILCDGEQINTESILFSFEIGQTRRDQHNMGFPAPPPGENSLRNTLALYEKQIISETLKTSKSIRKAARTLGISHTALLNKLKKHDITIMRE